jgi:L-arabinokinase
MTCSPAVVDVMGGIVEDSGSLVLTTTLATPGGVALWHIKDDLVRLRRGTMAGDDAALEFDLPIGAFEPSATTAEAIAARCREAGCEWAAPICLTLRQAIADAVLPQLEGGVIVLLQSELPPDTDLGNRWAQAAATIDGLCRLFGVDAEPLQKSRICAEAVLALTGLYNLRTPMTALCGPPVGSLLQLRFHPQLLCQPLALPPGIIIKAAKARLARPTTQQRLIDTRMCAEMGRCMIAELQQSDGLRDDPSADRLATITPAEYVERYRDRLPPKITGKAFLAKFGSFRGLNGELDPLSTYKIRSRAEHHIYENRRVHEFAASVVRGRRSQSPEALIHAGELMYASHWSHSQRCGIGGVEADQLVSAIRKHGPQTGLFGAKVTGGGDGGELVFLMRDDERAHAALADAIAAAEAASGQTIQLYGGAMAGAEIFQPSELDGAIGSGTSA